ncbi:unnamed protein product, partial [Staurois parvus]
LQLLSITNRGETLTYCCVFLCTANKYTAVSYPSKTHSTHSKTAHNTQLTL